MNGSGLDRVTNGEPVLVLGGGIAGMTAAWELKRRGIPARVIEATPHVGGRIHTVRQGSGLVETGMQFYYGAYRETKRLLRECGLEDQLVPIEVRGQMFWDGRIAPFSKSRPWLSMLSARQNLALQMSIARQAGPLMAMSPFEHAAEERLDRVGVDEYFRNRVDETTYEVAIRPMVNAYAFCEPEGHSLAMVLRILKLSGMAGTYGLRPGNDALPTAMARRLDVVHARAEHIELKDGRVHAVHIDRDGVKERLATSCVISALRAPDAQEILSDAPETAEELGALTYSSVVLANLHLDRPIPGPDWVYVFSRVAGHGAAFACDLTRRSPTMFEDEKAVLQLNFAAPVSDRLLRCSDAEIVEAALSDMQAFLPDVADWVERTSVVRRPRVLPNFPVGTFTLVERIKRLASSISGLHLAGDYLRSPLCEGAVRSAHQAVSQMV